MSDAASGSEARPRWTPTETFGDRLVLLRRHAGRISQAEAAERCGVNPKTWAQWELGRHPHQMGALLDRICDGFRDAEGRPVDRYWLLFGEVSSSGYKPAATFDVIDGKVPDQAERKQSIDRPLAAVVT